MFQIGTSLREARLRQGLDLVDAESATKIRPKYLEALEDERFDILPSPTYVKGFLRSYADFLGLDGQLYVDEYNSRYVAGDDDVAPRPARTTSSAAAVRSQRRAESRATMLALGGIATATALVFLAWKWGGDPDDSARPATGPKPASNATGRGQQAASSRASQRGWITLTLTARRENSLLTAYRIRRDGQQKLLWEGTLERGAKPRRLRGLRIRFLLARPRAVRARIDGRSVRIPARGTRPTVFVATRSGVKRAPS